MTETLYIWVGNRLPSDLLHFRELSLLPFLSAGQCQISKSRIQISDQWTDWGGTFLSFDFKTGYRLLGFRPHGTQNQRIFTTDKKDFDKGVKFDNCYVFPAHYTGTNDRLLWTNCKVDDFGSYMTSYGCKVSDEMFELFNELTQNSIQFYFLSSRTR